MAKRSALWAGFMLGSLCLLAGCKGFWDPPTTGTGGTGTASGVFYVLNQKTSEIGAFSFPSGSTTPTAITGSPYALAAAPLAMAIAPNGAFLYVSTTGGIFTYSIGTGGALTLLNNSQPIDQNDLPTSMAVDASGSWLLVSTSGLATLNAVPVVAGTGLLDAARTEQTANLPGSAVQQIAVSPQNSSTSYVFLALGTTGTVVLPFAAANANPFSTFTAYKVKNTNGSANAVAVDPSSRLLYIGETVASTAPQTGGLRVFTVGATSDKFTEVSGSPYPTGGTGPSAILATANYVYVANRAVSGSTDGNISGYPINSSGGSYTLGTLVNTIAAGQGTVGLAEESTSTYILAVNSGGSPDLSSYTIDATTSGKLVAGKTAATGTDPVQALAIVAVP